MDDFYTVSEFASIVGKDAGNIRRMLIKGEIKGDKIGNQWIIPKTESYPEDKRLKSGNYRNWRKKSAIYNADVCLMKSIGRMCHEIGDIYGSLLKKIVLYGSYARGEQTNESDVDIALFLDSNDDELHDKAIDVVLQHELDNGITISVIPIENKQYEEWRKALPFYKNIDKEGIVLWKSA